jgi:hypothetical protein
LDIIQIIEAESSHAHPNTIRVPDDQQAGYQNIIESGINREASGQSSNTAYP